MGLRKENASLEVYPDFPVEVDALLSGEKNFSHGGGVFPYSIATQLSWKSMGKEAVCVCVLLAVNLYLEEALLCTPSPYQNIYTRSSRNVKNKSIASSFHNNLFCPHQEKIRSIQKCKAERFIPALKDHLSGQRGDNSNTSLLASRRNNICCCCCSVNALFA